MLEIIQYIFSDFWRFIGFWILFACLFTGISKIILAIRGIQYEDKD